MRLSSVRSDIPMLNSTMQPYCCTFMEGVPLVFPSCSFIADSTTRMTLAASIFVMVSSSVTAKSPDSALQPWCCTPMSCACAVIAVSTRPMPPAATIATATSWSPARTDRIPHPFICTLHVPTCAVIDVSTRLMPPSSTIPSTLPPSPLAKSQITFEPIFCMSESPKCAVIASTTSRMPRPMMTSTQSLSAASSLSAMHPACCTTTCDLYLRMPSISACSPTSI
mmetsp:Transcript_92390/g.149180  ORF Transcript_92390/g.149180 Transcript_92390/m.149180 type:complete len:224 (-) Transcript_92390:138-809(-)